MDRAGGLAGDAGVMWGARKAVRPQANDEMNFMLPISHQAGRQVHLDYVVQPRATSSIAGLPKPSRVPIPTVPVGGLTAGEHYRVTLKIDGWP